MRRLLLTLSVLLATLVPVGLVTSSAGAVDVLNFCNNTTNAGKTDVCKDKKNQSTSTNPVITLVKDVIEIFTIIIGVAAVIVIIVSGINMITSGGDAQKAAQARSGLIYALVGLVIAAFAQAIVSLVLGRL
jgi:hypothetical protein